MLQLSLQFIGTRPIYLQVYEEVELGPVKPLEKMYGMRRWQSPNFYSELHTFPAVRGHLAQTNTNFFRVGSDRPA